MLDLSTVDLDEIAEALDDHTDYGRWWIDADTGEVWLWSGDVDDDAEFDPDLRPGARAIEPLPSSAGYADMEDFIARVLDRRAADLLERAIAGRGAFRRFKDTLFEFPDLRQAWFGFRDMRMRRRAIEAEAKAALASLDDPPLGDGSDVVDPRRVAGAVAADLRRLYGDRLVEVVLYGSHARGDAHPDSDVDLAVVLEDMSSPWEELRRMDEILWRHTLEYGVTVSATPVALMAWSRPDRPLVKAAKAEGVRIG